MQEEGGEGGLKLKSSAEEPVETEEAEEDEEVAEKRREMRRLKAEKELLKVRAEVEKLRAETEKLRREAEAPSAEGLGISEDMVKELAKLPDEERRKVVETYAMLRAAEGGKYSPWVMPLLVGYARAHPGSDVSSMAEFAKTMAEQVKIGFEMASRAQQQPAQASSVELLKLFAEIVRDNVKRPLEELVEKVQPQPSALEQILMNDKLFERAKALGLFGGGQAQGRPADLELEIEKLRTERDLKIEELRQQHERWLTEQQLEARKWEQIGRVFEGPVGRFIETVGGGAAERLRAAPGAAGQPPQAPQQLKIPGVEVERISCPTCRRQFYGNVLADFVVCPWCSAVLKKESPQPAQQPQQPAEVAKGGEAKPAAQPS
jgi:hypothetical protein